MTPGLCVGTGARGGVGSGRDVGDTTPGLDGFVHAAVFAGGVSFNEDVPVRVLSVAIAFARAAGDGGGCHTLQPTLRHEPRRFRTVSFLRQAGKALFG